MPGSRKAQRVKGNLKPSSSSQAAQLLAASGQAPVGFIGFSSQPAFVPASETFDDVDNSLDSDFRLVLRKLSKKDTVTKIKALQELTSLCADKSDDDIKAIIPFWPRIYNKVALDVDHKVRELSQKAMKALANRAGKNMAPHLKSVMGTWIVSMCDTYPTVALAANSAFVGTFPAPKQTDAIRFCKAEIAECLLKNILHHTAQTLSDPTSTSKEDMEAKYHRVVSSSLQGFRKLCTMLPSETVASSVSASFSTLLGDPALWKHTKSTIGTVKGGLLNLMSCICQYCPQVSGQFVGKICPFVFSCIDTSDATIVSHAWEALLSLISAHEDCWEHVNWQKAVWPKLKKLLEGGCFGLAVVIAPCFLPLFSKLPHRNFLPFFDAMRIGLTKDCLVNNQTEMSAFVQAFLECVQYSVKHMMDSDATKISVLLQDQVLVIVEAGLMEERPSLSKSPLFTLLAPLVSSVGTSHPEIEELFWKDLSAFIVSQVMAYQHNLVTDTEKEKNEQGQRILIQRLVLLTQGIAFHENVLGTKKVPIMTEQHGPEISVREKQKQVISLASETLISDSLVMSFCLINGYAAPQFLSLFKDISSIHIPASAGLRLISDDDPVKCKLSENFSEKVESKSDPYVQSQLSRFLEDSQPELEAETKHQQDFLYSRLLRLLLYHQKEDGLDLKYTEELLTCMFSFLTYLPEKIGSKFLSDTLQALSKPLITCQFIEHLLQQVGQIPACGKAMENLGINTKIETLATQVTEELDRLEKGEETKRDAEPVWKMLTSVMTYLNEGKGEPFPPSCVDCIMGCCQASLKWLSENSSVSSVPDLISLVQSLLERPYVVLHAGFEDLLLSLLSLALSCNITCSETVKELESTLSLCFKLISSQLSSASHMAALFNCVRDWVCTRLQSVEDLNKVSQVVRLMSAIKFDEDKEDDDDDEESSELTEKYEKVVANRSKLSPVILDVIVCEPLWVDEMEQIFSYLYVEGCRLPPNSCSGLSCAARVLSMKSYVLTVVHNLRTLCIGRQQAGAHSVSQKELEGLVTLAENVLVVDLIQKIHPQALADIRSVLGELKTGVTDFLAALTGQQLMTLVDLALNRSPSQLASLGLEKLLKCLLESDTKVHSKRATSTAFRLLKTSFLHQCLPDSSADEVISILKDKATLSEFELSEAYTLTCSLMASLDSCDVPQFSSCMAGFLSLLEDLPEKSHELKSVVFNQTLGMVRHLKGKGFHLLTGSDVELAGDADQVHYNACVARLTNAAVLYRSPEYWEFVLCPLVEWFQFLSEVNVSEESAKTIQALTVAVCQLAHMSAHTFINATVVPSITPDTPAFAVSEKMRVEWDEFFASGIFSPLLPLFVSQATQSLSQPASGTWTLVLKSMASAASLCPPNVASDHLLPARLSMTDTSALPDDLKTLLNHMCPLLNAKERQVAVAAFNILNGVIDSIPEHESKAVNACKEETEEEEARSPPEAILLTIESNALCLDGLMTVDIEAEVEVELGTDEHSHAMGYLLAWQLLLRLFKCSPNELRAKYAQFFKRQESVSHLLDHLFRLMPSAPSASLLEFNMAVDAADDSKPQEVFVLALNLYRQCLEVVPALVRTWWVDQNRKTSNFVDKFTTDYVTQSLCSQQLTTLQRSDSNIEDMTIRVRPAAREVCAVYQMAEVTVNMTISLPQNYPLGKMDVVCDKRVGVSQPQWDRWLLQLNIFLQQQNGSIVEGLKLWKGNIDKKFEGIDDCMICFSVIHGTTFQLPRLTCRTCRKKFHSSCLYKWFHTSQNSSCPLCRNLF